MAVKETFIRLSVVLSHLRCQTTPLFPSSACHVALGMQFACVGCEFPAAAVKNAFLLPCTCYCGVIVTRVECKVHVFILCVLDISLSLFQVFL